MAVPARIRSVTVFLSSSSSVDDVFREAAVRTAQGLAARGWGLVWGGASVGTMKVLGDAARESGCRTTAVVPREFDEYGIVYTGADEVIRTAGMRERKSVMEDRGDAFVALAGGIGTLEEVAELITSRQLGFHSKPVVLVNTDGIYDRFLEFLEVLVARRFAKRSLFDTFHVAPTPEEALAWLDAADPKPVESKWL